MRNKPSEVEMKVRVPREYAVALHALKLIRGKAINDMMLNSIEDTLRSDPRIWRVVEAIRANKPPQPIIHEPLVHENGKTPHA